MPIERPDEIIGDITNERGCIRLGLMRECFQWDGLETEKGRQIIQNCYEEWVKCTEYLCFAMLNTQTGQKDGVLYRKCSKRGNDVYRWRLKKRLSWIENLEKKDFFNPKDRNVRGETTRALFVSLTYDTKRCSRREAWENVSKEWNRWISAVRRRYGTVKHFRNFEAHQNGYPHIHAILLFSDTEFELSHRDKHGKFRILRAEKDWFASKWHSFVDVEACYSTGIFNYVKKYMLKVHGQRGVEAVGGGGIVKISRRHRVRTLSLLWLFRKQSFSVSQGMRELIYDLIEEWHNSNAIGFQTTLEGERLYVFELISVVTLDELAMRRKPPPDAEKKWSFTVFMRETHRGHHRVLNVDRSKTCFSIGALPGVSWLVSYIWDKLIGKLYKGWV